MKRVLRTRSVLMTLAWTGLTAAVWMLFLTYGPLPDPRPDPREVSTLVMDRRGELLRAYRGSRGEWYFPLEQEAVADLGLSRDSKLVHALTLAEDKRFFSHPGIDPWALFRAIRQNLRSGRVVSGGSTLTMQLTRLVGRRPRTLVHKSIEAVQALMYQRRYSKEQILVWYLAQAPFGGNIRGIGAASVLYFGTAPGQLTWAQAALLAVLPNAPGLIHPGANTRELELRRNNLLDTLADEGFLDRQGLDAAKAEPLPRGRFPLPFVAPHAADMVAPSGPGRVNTTLDGELQLQVESQARLAGHRLQSQGIENLSILVVHNPSGQVRGLVGNPFYGDSTTSGFVNGVTARRSTGSILKPLLYGLAFDRGLALPESLVADIPMQFGSFAPQNADQRFRGLIPLSRALAESLNLPAVAMLESLGVGTLYRALETAGFQGLFRSSREYGLSLVLGGAEASPWEVASLYRSFALGGRAAPIHLEPRNDRGPGPAVLSPAAAFQLAEILQLPSRPQNQRGWEHTLEGFPVAWKTGTSYGQRDAWAAGFTPLWTVVVWAGNFSGSPSANLSSTESAGSLLFEVMRLLGGWQPAPTPEGQASSPHHGTTSDRGAWFVRDPEWFREVQICAHTGYRAGPDCPEVEVSSMPRNAAPLALCPFHSDGIDPRILNFYQAQSLGLTPAWLQTMAVSQPADHRILYPEDGINIILPESGTLRMRGIYPQEGGRLYWYLDGRYLGSTDTPGQHWIDITAGDVQPGGAHRLTLVNDRGGRVSSRFTLEQGGATGR